MTDLVRIAARDGVVLDGGFDQAVETGSLPIDACLIVHGTGSNFYAGGMLETFAKGMSQAGVAALRINTRGHDGVCTLSGGVGRGGAAYETVSDCLLDIAAWIEFLAERGFQRILLAGHSMGGVKCSYFLAHQGHPLVKRLVVISSPRFCHAQYQADERAESFRRDYQRALDFVAAGNPEQLMQVTQPLPFLVTAAGFLLKYGPHDDYDLIRLLPRVSCPVLFTLGTRSVATSIAFSGLPAAISQLAETHPHIRLELVDGANTNYTGCDQIPFERTRIWLTTTK